MSEIFYPIKVVKRIILIEIIILISVLLIDIFQNSETWHWKWIIPGIILGILSAPLFIFYEKHKIKGEIYFGMTNRSLLIMFSISIIIGGTIGWFSRDIFEITGIDNRLILNLFFENAMVSVIIGSIISLVWIIRYEIRHLRPPKK